MSSKLTNKNQLYDFDAGLYDK